MFADLSEAMVRSINHQRVTDNKNINFQERRLFWEQQVKKE